MGESTVYQCFRFSYKRKDVREIARLLENVTHFLRAVFIQHAFSKSCGMNMIGEIPQAKPEEAHHMPRKASDFPDVQRFSTVETVSLDTESLAIVSLAINRAKKIAAIFSCDFFVIIFPNHLGVRRTHN
ncbi:hypothetical protein [Thalassobacillus cyri]|uniref:hypothetical protein n=1 Tax=Thalassobacillus cyri TaxID=571932 RepID=UPI001160067E|nr:hypothetical protein [Thalassobacillus cyri]